MELIITAHPILSIIGAVTSIAFGFATGAFCSISHDCTEDELKYQPKQQGEPYVDRYSY